jgi:predicted Zn-dependent protease
MDNDYKHADDLLSKASTAEPLNPEGLLLTAQVDLLLNNSDGAIESAKKLHGMPHEHFAIVHIIAAHAYLAKNMVDPAVGEYKQFLDEAPADPRAQKVRDELTALLKSKEQQQAQQAQQPQGSQGQQPVAEPKMP